MSDIEALLGKLSQSLAAARSLADDLYCDELAHELTQCRDYCDAAQDLASKRGDRLARDRADLRRQLQDIVDQL